MKRAAIIIGIVSMGLLSVCFLNTLADEDPMTDDEVILKPEGEGHRLLLPKDWPVERKHGVVSPVPFEQYLSMKFNQVKDRFKQTDARIAVLERRVEQLEQENAALQKRVHWLETRAQEQEVTHGHSTPNP